MANCKECGKRIDFDELNKDDQIGEDLQEVDDKIIKIPKFGKFPYIRRGRWFWHVECYPDKLPKDRRTAEHVKVLQKQNAEITKAYDLVTEEQYKLTADYTKAIEAGQRMFSEKNIYKDSLEKLREIRETESKQLLEKEMKLESNNTVLAVNMKTIKTELSNFKKEALAKENLLELNVNRLNKQIDALTDKNIELNEKIVDLKSQVEECDKLREQLKDLGLPEK